MWAGANPRSSGPTLDNNDELDDSTHTTAMAAAALAKDPKILMRLKPDPDVDNVDELLTNAATFGRVDAVRSLLRLGAKANDKPDGGCTALVECLATSLSCESFRLNLPSNWCRNLARVRRSLYECEPDVTVKVVEQLIRRTACTQVSIHKLLRTAAMKKHLSSVSRNSDCSDFMSGQVTKGEKKSSRRRSLANWALRELASKYNREEIYKEIWSEPMQRVAIRYGMSDVGLAEIC
jgi:hypothetical protein